VKKKKPKSKQAYITYTYTELPKPTYPSKKDMGETIFKLQAQLIGLQNDLALMTQKRDALQRAIDDDTKALRDLHTKCETYRKLILELFEGR
jgi:hypothetical protein